MERERDRKGKRHMEMKEDKYSTHYTLQLPGSSVEECYGGGGKAPAEPCLFPGQGSIYL